MISISGTALRRACRRPSGRVPHREMLFTSISQSHLLATLEYCSLLRFECIRRSFETVHVSRSLIFRRHTIWIAYVCLGKCNVSIRRSFAVRMSFILSACAKQCTYIKPSVETRGGISPCQFHPFCLLKIRNVSFAPPPTLLALEADKLPRLSAS